MPPRETCEYQADDGGYDREHDIVYGHKGLSVLRLTKNLLPQPFGSGRKADPTIDRGVRQK